MSKRPQIKGKGADIYLGGDSNGGPQETEPEKAKMSDNPDKGEGSQSSAKVGESFFGPNAVTKAAAWFIETGEKLASQAIDLQAKTTSWTRETPLGPLFELHTSMSRKCVERTASTARRLWQIH